ncbi:uncharacterized protein LOC120214603 [Hibiscus syriacus]|uniref:uncharacterized protein LOC120214603 n=1 Tax=Hibiscus syriacus TaxID=106335 RepID=UPI001922A0EF|nr:uncharacterized protein LOC120214603 [Hibiscus syriacus]
MKILSWNIRGMGSDVKISELRRIIRVNRIEVVVIQETKKDDFSDLEIGRIWFDDEFDFRFSKAVGRAGDIITVWDKSRFQLEDSFIQSRLILIRGKCTLDLSIYSLVNVYAPCDSSEQLSLWFEVESLRRTNNSRWFFGGYFNSSMLFEIEAREVENSKLLDMPLTGRKFTWFGPGNRRNRLDRIFVEEDWFKENSEATLWGLPREVSDHIPIILGKEMIDWGPRPFKIINAWLNQESCTEVIKETLELDAINDKDLFAKPRRVEGALKKWNKECFGTIDTEAQKMEAWINELDTKRDYMI